MDQELKHDETICNKCKIKPKKPRKQNKINNMCEKCGEVINNTQSFKKHINECYPLITCPICNSKFNVCTTIYTIKNHINACSDNNESFLIEFEKFLNINTTLK